jgi:hypothetical protein
LIILLVEGRTSTTKGGLVISVHDPVRGKAFGEVRRFRRAFYGCLTSRADAVFELADAVLCADGPVRSLAELSLVGEHRRGHGSPYAALSAGRVDIERLRTALTAVPLPRAVDGRLVLAVDITCWLRPHVHTSPERVLCHTYGRGKDQHIMIPGWPYSMVVALEPGRSSWTARSPAATATTSPSSSRSLTASHRSVASLVARCGDPIGCMPTAATTTTRAAACCANAASPRTSPDAALRTAPGWESTAGTSNAPLPARCWLFSRRKLRRGGGARRDDERRSSVGAATLLPETAIGRDCGTGASNGCERCRTCVNGCVIPNADLPKLRFSRSGR